jgi:hypothetical protein
MIIYSFGGVMYLTIASIILLLTIVFYLFILVLAVFPLDLTSHIATLLTFLPS